MRSSFRLFFMMIFLLSNAVMAQLKEGPVNSLEKRWFLLHAGIGYFDTYGDWSKRYPTHLSVPITIEYAHRSNWSFGADYSFYLGSNVDETDMYGNITDDSGVLIDMAGYPAIIRTYQRGFSTRVFVLKNWILHKNKDTRWLLQLGGGVGYFNHYTKFTFDLDQVPQIDGAFQGGYNQHTQGTTTFQQLKLLYLNNDAISFTIGMEAGQGSGSRVNPYDFASKTNNAGKTFSDAYFGGIFSVIIPINFRDRVTEVDYYME